MATPRKQARRARTTEPAARKKTARSSSATKATKGKTAAVKKAASAKKKSARKSAVKKTAAKKPAQRKAVKKSALKKAASRKPATTKRAKPALVKKAAARKGPLTRGDGSRREPALYAKEVEAVKHQMEAPIPKDDRHAPEPERPHATFDPTPDTHVHPRGHTGPDRHQSERAAALRQQRARFSQKSIPNATGRKGMGRKGRVG